MGGWVEQRLVLVLPVQLDEPLRQVTEGGRRGQGAVDEGPATAVARDVASND